MLEIVAAVLGAAALGPWVVKLFRAIERRYQAGDDAKMALLRSGSDHDAHELLDIRSNAFAPNELVATLCVTCDAQLGPEVWQRKADRELAALEGPDSHAEPLRSQHSRGELEKLGFKYTGQSKIGGSHNVLAHFTCKRNHNHNVQLILHDKQHLERFLAHKGFGGLWEGELDHGATSAYIQVRPAIPALDIRLDSPKGSWSADHYRRRGWTTELLDSNFDHSEQKYILPLFQGKRVNRLTFTDKAEATKWWGSCIPYDDFIAGRRTVKIGSGGIRSFSAERVTDTFRQEQEKITDQLARLTGIPAPIIGKMSAAQASEALNLAQFGVPAQMIWEKLPGWGAEDTKRALKVMEDAGLADEIEIHAWGEREPIVVKRWPGRMF